ncbi:Cg3 protein, putative [Plasmodium gallinaceum]|uniref:Cg3 protein, putative n=1 Tax=Plasmodium gallinaceum TaxID=5849 RepID=A0A1J1GZQ6_PLAGA|nr:Cg3 protein, putative [Plasmodium gallinaceum]CRG98056.1 Cg3 protein, putative [Plasmodium gallinaceum]
MNRIIKNYINNLHNIKILNYMNFDIKRSYFNVKNLKKKNFGNKLKYSTNNKEKISKKKNVFLTWKCLAFNLALTIPTLYLYILQDQKKRRNNVSKTSVQNIGKPLIGGDFTLVNQNGEIITNKSFKNKYCLIYFGFTYCPDICPQELEKQTIVIEKLRKKYGDLITPIFISVDPNRDTVAQINYYCKSFSDKLIGLTGTKELIKSVAKLFRVYYNENINNENTTNANKNDQYNYLIDHSIIHYLLDTEGQFVDFFGKNCTINEMVEKISHYLDEYLENKNKENKLHIINKNK